jgi:hypothetical protein
MQMWRHVAETGQVDFVRQKQLTNDKFDTEYDFHDRTALTWNQIGHLTDVITPDDAAKSRVIGIFNANDTAVLAIPKQNSARVDA